MGDIMPTHNSRREFLRNSAVTGVLTLFSQSGSAVGGRDDSVKIPIVKNRGEVLYSKEFPAKWESEINHIRDIYETAVNKWSGIRGVKDINRVRSQETIKNRNLTKINVEVIKDKYKGGIPEEIDGVPVQISEWSKPKPMGACYNDQDFSDVPGGVVNGTGSGNFGTSCGRIWDGDKYTLLTAKHMFAECTKSAYGDTVYQHGQKIGPVDTEHVDDDMILAKDKNSNLSISQDIDTNDGRIPLQGAVVDFDAMMSDDETVRSTGVMTAYETGKVDAYPVSGGNCWDFHGNGARTTCKVASGDSGGPVYWEYSVDGSTYVALVHLTTYGLNDTDDQVCDGSYIHKKRSGVSGDQLENEYGLGIGTK